MIVSPREKYYINDGCPICTYKLFWDDEKLGELTISRLRLIVNPLNYPSLLYNIGRSIHYVHSTKYKYKRIFIL